MSEIWKNIPYEDIKQIVKEDLECYGQDNPCPMSLTTVHKDGEGRKLWRHYELGACYGFVLYNMFYMSPRYNYDTKTNEYKLEESYRISTIIEDDENWSAPSTPMMCDSGWIEAIDKTWRRMVEWKKAHIIQGWNKDANISNPDEYRRETKLEILPEIVNWPDEEPDNGVLSTKFVYIDEED